MFKFLRIFILLFLLISVVNCATKKAVNSNPVISESTSKPTTEKNIEDFENLTFNYSLSTPEEKKWVDSIFNSLSTEEKIGQLFMVAAYSNKDSTHIKSLDKLIEEQKIGGLIFFQGGPVRQAQLTNRFQKKSKVPLFIGIDAEWGLVCVWILSIVFLGT